MGKGIFRKTRVIVARLLAFAAILSHRGSEFQKPSVEKQERKNTEFENRLVKVDQGSEVVDEQPQVKTEESAVDTKEMPSVSQNVKEAKLEESAVDVTPSGFSAPNNANTKSTEDEERINEEKRQKKGTDKLKQELFNPPSEIKDFDKTKSFGHIYRIILCFQAINPSLYILKHREP
uniref:Uncharacterized protein n=3 Tax=Rhizophagus irregularis TaxID=588596 RepID=U9TYP6_RHIID